MIMDLLFFNLLLEFIILSLSNRTIVVKTWSILYQNYAT